MTISDPSIGSLLPETAIPAKLDFGCGQAKQPGYIGMDIFPGDGVDVVHDFDKFPYPFADDSFDEIRCDNSLEHVADFIATVAELHRILKPGGLLKVLVPHYSGPNAYGDPTHKTFFAYTTFDRFIGAGSYRTPQSGMFRYRRRMFGMPDGRGSWFKALPKLLFNRFPHFYEHRLCWILPAQAIYYELDAVKPPAPGAAQR